jgi:hypothetical protein
MCLLGPIWAFSTSCGRCSVGACSRVAARSFPHSPIVVSVRQPCGGPGPHSRLGAGALRRSQWLIGSALKPNDLLGIANARPELFGAALHRFLETASRHLATMAFVGEKPPQVDDPVTLSTQTDAYGFPLAHVTHTFGPDDLQCYEAGVAEGQAIFKKAGAYEVWTGGRARIHTSCIPLSDISYSCHRKHVERRCY